jgi:hypothetical protein
LLQRSGDEPASFFAAEVVAAYVQALDVRGGRDDECNVAGVSRRDGVMAEVNVGDVRMCSHGGGGLFQARLVDAFERQLCEWCVVQSGKDTVQVHRHLPGDALRGEAMHAHGALVCLKPAQAAAGTFKKLDSKCNNKSMGECGVPNSMLLNNI